MRVVQLGPYPPPHGGVQTNLVAIRQYLRDHGHSCAVINITRHRQTEADQVYFPQSAFGLIGHLLQRRYDVIHLHIGGILPLRVLALAFVCTAIPWAKAILTFHSGGYPSSEEGKSVTPGSLRARVLQRFDGLIAVNREIVDFYYRLRVKHDRIRLIYPHSVAVSKVAPQLEGVLKPFYQSHRQILLAVCLLEPEYDLARQIEALPLILQTQPNTGLVIIGSGSLDKALEEQIAVSSAKHHILLCGDVPHEMTLRAIQNASILLRTTLYDGDAVSVREALYLGTRVIATDNGMRPPGVRLVPIGDTAALVEAVCAELRTGHSTEARPEADQSNLEAVLQLYEDVLHGPG